MDKALTVQVLGQFRSSELMQTPGRCGSLPVIPELRGQTRGNPGASWLARPAVCEVLISTERHCLVASVNKMEKEPKRLPTIALGPYMCVTYVHGTPTHMHVPTHVNIHTHTMCVCACVHTYTHAHDCAQKKKTRMCVALRWSFWDLWD